MPSSSKRRTRQREVDLHETSDVEMPDSSPTRPSAKKRRGNGGRASPKFKPQTPEPTPADEQDSSIVETNQDLIDSVIACLAVPKEPTTAMTEFSNTKENDTGSVQAYAKIAGRTWTYFVKQTRVNIGRPREEAELSQRQDLQSSPVPEQELLPVDIDLGPSKYVSRHHASIYYDDGKWCITVNGRNGIRVNTSHIKRGQSYQLSCGDVIEISNTQMMFITPEQEPTINHVFIDIAKRVAAGEDASAWNGQPHGHPELGPLTRGSLRGSDPIQTYLPPGQVPLAPAPPYFKRQTTPKHERKEESGSRTKQSPLYNRGMMMESTEEIDFSKDAAKDLKPPYSYATMIAQAIFSSEEEKLTLNNIYTWIMDKYAFYRHSQTGWQNSIRHNLSLNKAFQKVPRRTDEPGKGMKWQIVPESRDEFLKKQAPRKMGNSSAPNSPAGPKDYSVFKSSTTSGNPGYDRSYEGQFSVASASQTSPTQPAPHFISFPAHSGPPEAYTPERGPRPRYPHDSNHTDPASPGFNDGSPLPTRPRSNHLTDRAQVREETSPPTLSSSFFHDETPSHSMITPAPRRQQPRLAPPSTAQLPSKFMPQSSPAPFWTMANMTGHTPMLGQGLGLSSPLKGGAKFGGDDTVDLPSSSPLQQTSGGVREMGSPTKREIKRERSQLGSQDTIVKSESQSDIPSQNQNQESAPLQLQRPGGGLGAVAGIGREGTETKTTTNGVGVGAGGELRTPDEEAGAGGFDLAKGFQPISSFHAGLMEATKAGSG